MTRPASQEPGEGGVERATFAPLMLQLPLRLFIALTQAPSGSWAVNGVERLCGVRRARFGVEGQGLHVWFGKWVLTFGRRTPLLYRLRRTTP